MKKRIFILAMAILSTSAFGTEYTQDPVVHTITLKGQAFTPITITGDKEVDFGSVVINKTNEKTVILTINGEIGGNVSFAQQISGTTVVTAPPMIPVTLDDGTATSALVLTYAPTETAHDLSNASVTVTATYAD
ncbi:MAG: hypothetical protein ACRC0R_07440 [Cetobacterium sp.]